MQSELTYNYERPGVVVLLLAEAVHCQHDEANDEEDEATTEAVDEGNGDANGNAGHVADDGWWC